MEHKNFGQLNVKPLVDDLVQKLDDAATRLQREGQEAGEAVGQGWDEGINDTVERIKASSIKTDKAFKNLSEKIKKQVQQLTANINGKDTKIKIDFSDIDMNSDDIKKQIEKKITNIKADDVIDFDTKGFDNQLTNFVTLFVKYQEKFKSLKQAYPNISVPKDAQDNLQQQLVLATELKQMYKLLNKPTDLFSNANPNMILKDLSKIQQFTENTKAPTTVKVTPVADGTSNSEQTVDEEVQSAVDVTKSFVDAANAKKQFVEANKKVANSAKESAKAVKEESEAAEQAKQTMTVVTDDTVSPSNWDKVSQLQADHGEDPFALSRSRTENVGDKSIRTIVESWGAIKDEDGNLTGEMELNTVKIINDFKKRTDAITKENEKIKTAQAYLQKFLTQFNNKTMGKGSLLTGYQDLIDLANSPDFKIDDIAKAEQMMSSLDAEYNKVVQSMRKGSSSMNPFVNAINGMDKMEDVLRSLSLQFKTLNQQPDWLNNDIIGLYKQLDNLSTETDIYKFAEGFGNLKVSINSVTESIRQQRVEQKLALSDFNALVKATKTRDTNTEKAAKEEKGSDWERYYLDRATEEQKIIDAISIGLTLTEGQEAELSALSERHALILKDINLENNKIEEQKQKYEEIMQLLEKNHTEQIGLGSGSLKVVDKDAYQQRLDNERIQIDSLIKGAGLNPEQTRTVEQFIKLIASLKVESSNIDLMSKKWMEQNILTDEAKSKIEALKQVLVKVTSSTELDLWKKQWKELSNEMSMANIEAKADKNVGKLIEDDRVAEVKKYIDLLKTQYDYEKKAAKEDNGSKMQSFYNEQIAKVKEKIQQTDINTIANQEEKNKLLALEEAHQRTIAEIKARQGTPKQDKEAEKKLFIPQDKKIQDRFDAGYLNKGQYDNWQRELVEYQNYMKGITQADETTIKNKKQSLMQLYDTLVKTSNASKSFFTSGGEVLPKEMWLDRSQIDDTSKSLMALYNNIATERFEGMKTSITGVNDKLGKLNFVVDDGQGSLTQYTIALDKASGATKLLQNNTKPALTVLQKFGQTLKKDFTGLLTAVMGGTSIHTFVQYMRQGIQSVRELDLALTELKKVTDATEETYDKFLDTAASTSSRIGSTLSNMTSATAEFAKLGYDITTAASMAESALVYTNVGDNVDVETGSQSIISTLKAFGIEANNTMSIVDKFNEVGNNFAITTKGIGDALQVSASAMAAAGNSLDETIALTTAANTIVQNPNTVGTALKTLSLRIRGVKTELEEAGLETEGMAETTSQLQAKLKALTDGKVDIMVDADNFKNTTEILREMSAEWEHMTDVEQAAALELLGGKRQANTLSAIIANFDIVEDAIEASANSEGSALEENAKVLDSIQGRINLFNNALQTMWNNALDSDLIKGIVNFGTEVIKVIDKVGLLNSALLALGTFKGLKYLSKSFGISSIIGDALKATNALKLLDAETRKITLAMITEGLQVKLASSALVEYAINTGLATAADVTKMTTTQLLGLSFKALGVAILNATKAMLSFLVTNPIGWAILATAAIAGVVAVVNHFHKSTEELAEELEKLKSEISDIQSELNSLNSELETTRSRIAELLAMDSLSFTEQEELNNLRKQNDELERQVYLLEQREKRKQKEAEEAFVETINSDLDTTHSLGGVHVTTRQNIDIGLTAYKKSKEEIDNAKDELVEAEAKLEAATTEKEEKEAEKEVKKAEKKIEKKEKEANNYSDYLSEKIGEYTEYADGIDYKLADEETKKLLDYIYNLEDAYNIVNGDDEAKTVALTRIFNKEEYEAIDDISDKVSKAKEDLEAVGLSTQDAIDYFTLESGMFNSDTIEGIISQYQKGINVLEQFKNAQTVLYTNQDGIEEQITWEDLFDWDEASKEATANSEVIAKVLQGADEKTREAFSNLVENVAEGNLDFNQAIKSFGFSGTIRGFELVEEQISAMNTDIFKDLGDELSGVIDTFSEFGAALESVANSMEILHTAQTQMNNSNRISVKTALDLINSTDQWNEVLKIENGNIQLVDNAEEILIQTKLDHVKANLQAALSTVEAQLAQIAATGSAQELATTLEESTNMAVVSLAENMAYLSGLVEAFANGNWGGAVAAAEAARSAVTIKTTSYRSGSSVSQSDLQQKKENIEAQLAMLEGIDTVDEFKNNYDFDKTPGDKYKDSDSGSDSDDAFQKAMDYWENRIGANQARYEQLQNEIDLIEKQGGIAGEEYYEEQVKLEKQRLKLLEAQKAEAKKFLGTFTEGSDEWWEAANTLNDIEGEIDSVTASIQDLNDAMNQIKWTIFDEAHERFDNLISQLQNVREVLSTDEDTFFDDEGNWTETGVAVLGTYIQEIEHYKNSLADVEKELKKLQKVNPKSSKSLKAAGFDSEQEYYDKLQELIEKQNEYTLVISDSEQAVVDMYESQIDAIEEYTDKLVDSYNEYIDVVKEALDAERDLYDFKKNVEKQTKDIATLERRIASLSGSTDASDIAERRKLEAELTEAKEGLNDTYYDHAKDAQSKALDDEASAYEESLTNYIEMLREKLDEAKLNMDLFMEQVTAVVTANAGTVLDKYVETGIAIDTALTTPWKNAAEAMKNYERDSLIALMNTWTKAGETGYFYNFNTEATKQLKSPFNAGKTAMKSFQGDVEDQMAKVVSNIKSNVSKAKTELSNLYKQIQDTEKKAATVQTSSGGSGGGGYTGGGYTGGGNFNPNIKALQEVLNSVFSAGIAADGVWGPKTENALKKAQTSIKNFLGNKGYRDLLTVNGKFDAKTRQNMLTYFDLMSNAAQSNDHPEAVQTYVNAKKKLPVAFHAKGTLGTKRDEWAITDESWIGEEITLAAGRNGQLQYLKKGSAVMPADISTNLVEWGKLDPNALSMPTMSSGVNIMSNAIIQPNFEMNFDSLVHVDHCDQGTLKDLERMVDTKINQFGKQMNYAIKKIGGR